VIEEIDPAGDASLLREGSALLRTGVVLTAPAVGGNDETMRWV
jgi:hypothetical protein